MIRVLTDSVADLAPERRLSMLNFEVSYMQFQNFESGTLSSNICFLRT